MLNCYILLPNVFQFAIVIGDDRLEAVAWRWSRQFSPGRLEQRF